MTKKSLKLNRGYTLLFSVIVSALVLGIAVFIVNVSRKQFELSVSSKNSTSAFYAADSGIECAVNNLRWNVVDPNTLRGDDPDIGCWSQVVSLDEDGTVNGNFSGLLNPADTRQWDGFVALDFRNDQLTTLQCFQLIVTTGTDPITGNPKTIIDSRGYNMCQLTPTIGPDIDSISTVERALRLTQDGVW